MASIGHIAVACAAARFEHRRSRLGWSLGLSMVVLTGLSLLPDLDVIAFRLGVAYAAPFGHRGASHSLAAAAVAGLLTALAGRRTTEGGAWRMGVVAGLVIASHGALDMLTDGGSGIAWLWPFSDARLFAPWRPLPVAPIGLNFLSSRGWHVAATELIYFFPLLAYAFWPTTRNASGRRP